MCAVRVVASHVHLRRRFYNDLRDAAASIQHPASLRTPHSGRLIDNVGARMCNACCKHINVISIRFELLNLKDVDLT